MPPGRKAEARESSQVVTGAGDDSGEVRVFLAENGVDCEVDVSNGTLLNNQKRLCLLLTE